MSRKSPDIAAMEAEHQAHVHSLMLEMFVMHGALQSAHAALATVVKHSIPGSEFIQGPCRTVALHGLEATERALLPKEYRR